MKYICALAFLFFSNFSWSQKNGIPIYFANINSLEHLKARHLGGDKYIVFNESGSKRKEFTISKGEKQPWIEETYVLRYVTTFGRDAEEEFFYNEGALYANSVHDIRKLYDVEKKDLPYFILGLHYSKGDYATIKRAYDFGDFDSLCSKYREWQRKLNNFGLWCYADNKIYGR